MNPAMRWFSTACVFAMLIRIVSVSKVATGENPATRDYNLVMKLKSWLVLLACMSLTCTGLTRARAQNATGELKPSRIFETARPATVMVQFVYGCQIVIPGYRTNQPALRRLARQLALQIRAGQIARNKNALVVAVLEALVARPNVYIVPDYGQKRTQTVQLSAIGSGFLLTPDGYVVTNAHVAAPDDATLKRALAEKALGSLLKEDLAELDKDLGSSATAEARALATRFIVGYYVRNMVLGRVTKKAFAEIGVAVPGLETIQTGIPLELVTAGQQIPGKDVAILKMKRKQNLDNLMTLPLGDDTALRTGDRLYVVGYPGVATFHPLLSKESQIEPTFTQGLVSAKKQMAGGWSVLQTDANITHGNSGGPVMNERGEVIGLATFGSVNAEGQEASGYNFVVPMSVVQEFLKKARVQPKEGDVSRFYKQALDARDSGDHATALQLLQKVSALSPGLPEVSEQVMKEQKIVDKSGGAGAGTGGVAASSGAGSNGAKGSGGGSMLGALLVLGVMGTGLLVGIGVLAYMLGRGSKR